MSRRAYRATRVNDVNWEQIARGKEGLGVTLGVDVGKFDVLVVCRWADGRFERPWRVKLRPNRFPASSLYHFRVVLDYKRLNHDGDACRSYSGCRAG